MFPLVGALLSSALTLLYLQTITTTYGAVAQIRVDEALDPAESDHALTRLTSSGVSRSDDLPFLPNPDTAPSILAARTAKVIPGMTPETVEDSVQVTDSNAEPEFEAFQEPVRTLEIHARATSARGAARLANIYAREYVAYHREFLARRTTAVRAGLALRALAARMVPNTGPPQGSFQRWVREVAEVAELERRRLRLYSSATAAETTRSPRAMRDVSVAALIGAFAGALLASLAPTANGRSRQST